eukprot:948763-Heterocapsa_arctica.AAC.1
MLIDVKHQYLYDVTPRVPPKPAVMIGSPLGVNMVHSVLIMTMYILINVKPQYLYDVAPRVPPKPAFMIGSPIGANMVLSVLSMTI